MGDRAGSTVHLSPVSTVLLIVLPVLAMAAATLVVRRRLPDTIAVQWGLDGEPNYGVSPFWETVLLCATWLVAAYPFMTTLLQGAGGRISRGSVITSGLVFGLVLAVHISILALNLDAEDWQAARRLTWPLISLPLLAGLVGGAVAWILVRAPHETN